MNNCGNCKWFTSWQDLYDGDELEPHDCGICENNKNEQPNGDYKYISIEDVCSLHESSKLEDDGVKN